MAGVVRAGVNANWLLEEVGPMLLKDLQAPSPSSGGVLDLARLQAAIATVEEALQATRRTAAPEKKAELVLAVYDVLQEPGTTRAKVLTLVKLAV